MKKVFLKTILPAVLTVVLSSCSGFETHPYDVNIKGEKGINAKQMAIIEKEFANKEELRIAFISDTHLWIGDARDQVADVNNRKVDFVVHCGDLTDTATEKEFEWSRDVLTGLNCPFVALIGNHDFLGTGNQTYEVMYGDCDFSFIAGRVKFICLNTNAVEYDYLAAVPNFDFLEEQFTKDTDKFDRTVIVMHAAPYSDQFNNNVCKAFRRYLDFAPGLMCCIYGHDHNDTVSDIYGDGLMFYAIDCANHRNYRIMTISPKLKDGYEIEQIRY